MHTRTTPYQYPLIASEHHIDVWLAYYGEIAAASPQLSRHVNVC